MRAPTSIVATALAALLATACGDGFEGGAATGEGGAAGAGATSSTQGAGGSAAPEVGCADGERELFEDLAAEPKVAGCAGGFGVEGVTSPQSQMPACDRKAGDDGQDPKGGGCSVADFCAEGWHVCRSHFELAQSLTTASACPPGPQFSFWVTRQAQDEMGACVTGMPVVNNVAGCGSDYGLAAHASCTALNRVLRWDNCAQTTAWECGSMGDPNQEANLIRKDGPEEGGVLCCKD